MGKFTEGHEKKGGRQKGSPNKLTKTVKEAVLDAFNELQQDPKANIVDWGRRNPGMFYQIAAKLIPTEIQGNVKTVIKVNLKEKGLDKGD